MSLRNTPTDIGAAITELISGGITADELEGVVALIQPAPPTTWPTAIAFITFDGERKTGKCLLCGKSGIASYTGEGLTWKLCMTHAEIMARWAKTNLPAMREHADLAAADLAAARLERTAVRMERDLRAARERRLSRLEAAGSASAGIQSAPVTSLPEPSPESAAPGGGEETTSAVGASAASTPGIATDDVGARKE